MKVQSTEDGGVSISDRLMQEPFWIGIIVVLGVLVISGCVIYVKKRCIKHIDKFPCCKNNDKTESTYLDHKGNAQSFIKERRNVPNFFGWLLIT